MKIIKLNKSELEEHRKSWIKFSNKSDTKYLQFFIDCRTGMINDSVWLAHLTEDKFTNRTGTKYINVEVI
jgi:hypothetical protein